MAPPQNKTWHGRIRKSGEKQQKLRHYLLSVKIKKSCIVMIMVHWRHIRAEKEEWEAAVEINMLVKMISAMTERRLNRTNSYLLQLMIHSLNLLTTLSLFLCFSFYCTTVLWKYVYFNSEFTVRSLILEGS